MDNDTSTCSIRSSSVKVQKIFDQYMAQIAPLPHLQNSTNKENSFSISNDQRSNYHTRIQTPDKTTQRSNSQIQALQALQRKNLELKTDNDSLKEQLKNYQNQQSTINEINTIYQNLQQQYIALDLDHKQLLQSYELQLSQLKLEKDQCIDSINRQYKLQLEEMKQQMQLQNERYKNIEVCRNDQDSLLQNTLDELRKERQMLNKLKLDQRLSIEDNEQQYEKQLHYQQKLYQEMKNQNAILVKEKQDQQEQIKELETTYKELVSHQKQEIQKLQKQYTDIKGFFEAQMQQVQTEVSCAMQELRSKNSTYHQQLQEQELIIEDLEDLNRQLKQQLLFKDSELINLKSQLEQLQIQHEQLKQMNDELINQFNLQIQDLSQKIEVEKQNFDEESELNDDDKKEIYNALHNDKTLQLTTSHSQNDLLYQQQPQTSTRDLEYKLLLSQIIEVEKEAFRLNNNYQTQFQQFSKNTQLSEQQKQHLKQEMTDLMQKIRINNSKLYELKAKEFTYLS
ncbi:unnamed protein product (macronuclear) [Paramecium tetraurelia]|uniref:Uncharacterized protein n=1 Tax=Paramecium tetraurelia TaxID=5888 RepID=A0BJ25_PARTE|nr:uncharacterized protein GSPATT00004915001 [Paramecium tetraurelia]CAK58542.1 unnamed protein product [Paramecium tetraurelia]|eukprot:XP_001425940.1 hypothetical protein (macronuclear) [Paramecium tetraurelia strain d4-2]